MGLEAPSHDSSQGDGNLPACRTRTLSLSASAAPAVCLVITESPARVCVQQGLVYRPFPFQSTSASIHWIVWAFNRRCTQCARLSTTSFVLAIPAAYIHPALSLLLILTGVLLYFLPNAFLTNGIHNLRMDMYRHFVVSCKFKDFFKQWVIQILSFIA